MQPGRLQVEVNPRPPYPSKPAGFTVHIGNAIVATLTEEDVKRAWAEYIAAKNAWRTFIES